VKLNKVTVTVVPAQDDEFAKDVSEFDTLDELKADIRAKALESAQKQADSAFENACVEKAAANVTVDMPKAMIEAELDRMAQNVASTETVERAAEMGDTANINFEGFDNGVPFDGGKGENFDLKLGSGSFVPGFEEQVVGMSAGEEKDIDITFPEDYHANLAGKPVVFHVKCNKVTTTTVPALDDEFAKDVSEFDTLDELKADIRAKALENAQKQIDSAFENACVEKAAANVTVEMPKAMIEAELDNQMERFGYQLQMSGYSMEQYAKMMGGDVSTMRNAFRPAAEKQALTNVTLAKIVEVEGIEANEDEIAAEFEALAGKYEMTVEKIKDMIPVEEVKESLVTRKAVKVIVDSAVAVAPKAE
jgi:trigger factor